MKKNFVAMIVTAALACAAGSAMAATQDTIVDGGTIYF